MNNLVAKIMLLVLFVFSTTSCTSHLAYKKNSGDPASPGNNEMVFGLRNSTIIIRSSDKKMDNNIVEVNCKKTDEDILKKCLSGVIAEPAPSLDMPNFYTAKWGFGTTLSEYKAVDTEPLMVKSFTVNYKNPASGIITSAGTYTATGLAIGGPYGGVIGGFVGAAIGISNVKLARIKLPVGPPYCEEVESAQLKALKGNRAELYLPVILTNTISGSLSEECWHPLPNRSPEAKQSEMEKPQGMPQLSGWFYRIVAGEILNSKFPPVLPKDLDSIETLGSPFQKRDTYFAATDSKTTFPVSACRAVELQITWWEEIAKKKGEQRIVNFSLMVADSNYIQAIRLPKKGTINLLPVCGGYASPTQSSSSAGDVIDAIVKQAQAIKAAQDKYDGK